MDLPKRVLVTRAAHQGSELAGCLRSLGLDPVLLPTIETVEPTSFVALDRALAQLDRFHWILFTSANAVSVFGKRISERKLAVAAMLGAIGPSTARALETEGLTPTLVPLQAVAESFATALLPHALQANGSPTRFLLIRAEDAREHLPETLRAAGSEVTVAPAYRTVLPAGATDQLRDLFAPGGEGVSAITFTSSSTARNFLALCDAAQMAPPERTLRVSIGPITSGTLRDLGYPPHAEAPEATTAALARTVLQSLLRRDQE